MSPEHLVKKTLAFWREDSARDLVVTIERAHYTNPSRIFFALAGTPPKGFGDLESLGGISLVDRSELAPDDYQLFVRTVSGRRRRIKDRRLVMAFVKVAIARSGEA